MNRGVIRVIESLARQYVCNKAVTPQNYRGKRQGRRLALLSSLQLGRVPEVEYGSGYQSYFTRHSLTTNQIHAFAMILLANDVELEGEGETLFE